jgi:lipopolysaccharide/colanic/teichoic acid biosynthesis glycosyltransferase
VSLDTDIMQSVALPRREPVAVQPDSGLLPAGPTTELPVVSIGSSRLSRVLDFEIGLASLRYSWLTRRDELESTPNEFSLPITSEPRATWPWSAKKRVLDLVLCLVALPPAVMLITAMSAISAVVFRCNPLFIQQRRGLDDAPISILKIRSLPKSFPDKHPKHHLADVAFTGWSRLLRESHLDELPQIFNIIGGSMSIVGPRPMIDEVLAELEVQDRKIRGTVKPGMTGPWQISTMGSVSLHDCPELDNQYVESASLRSDARLIWWTFRSMTGQRALEPEEVVRRLGW